MDYLRSDPNLFDNFKDNINTNKETATTEETCNPDSNSISRKDFFY